jgi:serine protease Do
MPHVRRSLAAVLFGALLLAGTAAVLPAGAAPPNVVVSLPSLPPSGTGVQAGPDAGGPHAATGDKVRRGVVGVELGGKTVAIGTVLGTDGRVLTALSSLGVGADFDVRYADGHTAKAKLGHKDVGFDLALLVPQTGKWTDGLSASENDPAWVELRAMGVGPQGKIAPLAAKVKGRVEARGKDGTVLPNVLDLELGAGAIPGASLIDNGGAVVGIVVRACTSMDAGPCMPRSVGAPIAIVRSFLMKTPAAAVQPAPWLGINGVSEGSGPAKGVRVVAVAPQSPAEKGGLKAGADLIAAVDGQPVDSPERMAELIGKHAVNETVKLLVLSSEKFREVVIILKPAPAP